MKKLITYLTICITASVFITSCKTNTSLTERRYNKGYYVTHIKDNPSTGLLSENKKTTLAEAAKPINNEKDKVSENAPNENLIENPKTSNKIAEINNDKKSQKTISQTKLKQSLKNNIANFENPAIKVKRALSSANTTSYTHDGDGLSLLWIVIVVVLILWLFGFIGGLGGFINLLLLVALILLILWLLRVI